MKLWDRLFSGDNDLQERGVVVPLTLCSVCGVWYDPKTDVCVCENYAPQEKPVEAVLNPSYVKTNRKLLTKDSMAHCGARCD